MQLGLSENALRVLERRYLKKDETGKVIETPEELFERVASAIASADKIYGKTDKQIQDLKDSFYRIMTKLEFIPNSPCLMNAGRELGQLSACFTLPINDSMDSIFETLKATAMIHKSGGILKAKADLELQLGNLRNDLKSAQINNEELQRTKASLELEITNLNREKSELQRQAEYNQKMIDSITADIARERNDKFNIAGDLKAIKSENKILRRQLSSLNNRKIELERKLQDVVESKVNLEKDYANMESILKDKVGEVCRLKDRISESVASAADDNTKPAMNKGNSSINLPPIVIRPPADNPVKSSTSGLLGKVLTINKDNNFVVIDLGEDAGVKVGDTFKIYRQDKLVGNVLVIQTRRDISACDIKKEVGSIKIGDTVR